MVVGSPRDDCSATNLADIRRALASNRDAGIAWRRPESYQVPARFRQLFHAKRRWNAHRGTSLSSGGAAVSVTRWQGWGAQVDARQLFEFTCRFTDAHAKPHSTRPNVTDTAVAMGCSEGSVKTHLSRAIHALREQLEEWQ